MSNKILSLEKLNYMLIKLNRTPAKFMNYEYKRRYVTDNYFIEILSLSGNREKYFLKVYHANRVDVSKEIKEIEFYTKIAKQMTEFSFVPVYDIGIWENGEEYILMPDMSDTHVSLINCHNCSDKKIIEYMECMAKFHAFWWDDKKLGKSIGEKISKNSFSMYVKNLANSFEIFKKQMGNKISLQYMKNIDTILTHWELFFDRINSNINLTIIHGDANPLGNVLFPRSEGDAVLPIDWQGWNINMAIKDFAHAVGLNFYPHQRHNFEKELLYRYHELLIEYGVTNYSFAECIEDYKMCLCANLFSPIILSSWGISEGVWWPYYVKGEANVEDMKCLEILKS